ncbi:MAG: hypothetical protein JWQ32_2059 [Marmoricola sp.]|nr:hypothetical protein [Marmoricola sp.]
MTTQTQAPGPEGQTKAEIPVSPELAAVITKAKVRRPGFLKEEPQLSPSDPNPELGTDDSSDGAGDFPRPSEQMPDESSSKSGSSRTSSRAERKALQQAISVGFAGATTGAHEFLVRDPHSKYVGLLLADEQDTEAIGEPAANLLSRRMGDVPLGGDLGDVVALLVAVVGYGLKQLGKLRLARHLRDGGAALDGLQPNLGEQLPPEAPAPYDIPLAGE